MALYYDASSAYLGPLLKKHAAGQPLVWEDLVASHAASADVLRQNNNTFVSVSWIKTNKNNKVNHTNIKIK